MSEPLIGQITLFAGNFAPRGWAFCDGQLLQISQNTALFSILGTAFGGDGRTTFALPDLRGRSPIHPGTGPGLPTYRLGQKGGSFGITQSPAHTHSFAMPASNQPADQDSPQNNVPASLETDAYHTTADTTMGAGTTGSAGPSNVNIMNPYLAIYHIIALVGLFPSRN